MSRPGTHDSLCPWAEYANHGITPPPVEDCIYCPRLREARADERERREEFWEARWREAAEQREQAWTDLAHAEAVAARLVEVMCEQEEQADWRVFRMILRGIKMRDEALESLRAQIAADIEAHYTPLNGDVGPSDYDEGLHVAALLARGQCGYVDCMACARIARGES